MTDRTDGVDQSLRRESEHELESWARGLIKFGVRAALLPFALLMASPSAIARAATSGNYRPLPSPFLLALTSGVIISGPVSSIQVLFTPGKTVEDFFTELRRAFSSFASSIFQSFGDLQTMVMAIPYILVLWVMAGLVSVLLFRTRTAEALFAAISLCVAALVEVLAVLLALATFGALSWIPGVENVLLAGVLLYALLLAIKLIRVVFVLRRETDAPLGGAIAASVPCFILISMVGVLGAGMLWGMAVLQRWEDEAKKDTAELIAATAAQSASLEAAGQSAPNVTPPPSDAPVSSGKEPAPAPDNAPFDPRANPVPAAPASAR